MFTIKIILRNGKVCKPFGKMTLHEARYTRDWVNKHFKSHKSVHVVLRWK